MSQPDCPQKAPYKAEVEAGKRYFWCACGKSQNQPFCDGSHKGSSFSPVVFEPDASKTVFLCGCKQTGNAPMCDGSHKSV